MQFYCNCGKYVYYRDIIVLDLTASSKGQTVFQKSCIVGSFNVKVRDVIFLKKIGLETEARDAFSSKYTSIYFCDYEYSYTNFKSF